MNKSTIKAVNQVIKSLSNHYSKKRIGYLKGDHNVFISDIALIDSKVIDFKDFTNQSPLDIQAYDKLINNYSDYDISFKLSTNQVLGLLKGYYRKDDLVRFTSEDNTSYMQVVRDHTIYKSVEIPYINTDIDLFININYFKKLLELIKSIDGITSVITINYIDDHKPIIINSDSLSVHLAPYRVINTELLKDYTKKHNKEGSN